MGVALVLARCRLGGRRRRRAVRGLARLRGGLGGVSVLAGAPSNRDRRRQDLSDHGRVRGGGDRGANEQGVNEPGQAAYVVGSLHPGLTHEHHASRSQRSHLLGPGDIRGQGAQVTVVDPHHRGAQRCGPVHLLRRGDLSEHVHAQLSGQGRQVTVDVVGHHREHEQDRVRAQAAGREHLDGVDDEVLAQHRHVHHRAHRREVLEGACEAVRLGEHRDSGSPGHVSAGQSRRVVVVADGPA